MPPKCSARGNHPEDEPSKYRTRRNTIPAAQPNAHGIIFDIPAHEVRYSYHVRRKMMPTRYMCSKNLSELDLSNEINRMLHMLGVLESMHYKASTFERITLKFFSYVDFKLHHIWDAYLWLQTELGDLRAEKTH